VGAGKETPEARKTGGLGESGKSEKILYHLIEE